MTMQRWKLTIEYKGTEYHGWQIQDEVPTVQRAVEDSIEKFCQQRLSVCASGRTDTGVHARGQVVHFDLDYGDRPLSGFDLAKAINAHLRPQTIVILKAEEVSNDFHARYGALNKLYQYRIINRPIPLAVEKGLAWQFKKPLDVKAMHEAAQILTGHHDFTSFRDSECQAKSPEKTLNRLDVSARDYDGCGGIEIVIEAEAQSFLHHQMRNMVGSLTMVGEGKWSVSDMRKVMEAKDRTKGGPTAPAEGLYLMRVDYKEFDTI